MPIPEQIGIYQVVRELGRGAMGVVYLCVHPGLGRQVAVKVLSPHVAAEADFLERFRREGEMAAKLRHPNIVQVYDFCSDGGDHCFIVMEYLGAQTLKGGARPVPEAARLLDQLLAALEHAHENGVVHRDLKPSNILLTDKGEVALTDFGISQSAAHQKLTRTGTAMGTPEYMAPEQFDGKTDVRTDLYAVGILFYELLTGFTPFQADTLTEVMKNQVLKAHAPLSEVDFTIPLPISHLVDKALSKEPQDRFQTAGEMREALRLAQMAPLAAPPKAEPTALADSPRRRPRREGRGLVIFLVVILALTAWARKNHRPPEIPALPAVITTTSAPVVITDPVAPATPPTADLATPTMSPPPLALTETPEPVVETGTPTPAALRPPEEGTIQPGQGAAGLVLGASPAQAESVWGPPDSRTDEGGKLRFAYLGADGAESFRLLFDSGVLVALEVCSPRLALEGHPELSVGASLEKVREDLAQPVKDLGTALDYSEMGLYFGFNSRGCDAIRVYAPGSSGAP
ncbi:hypothetical protein ABS71_18950 [bacterium SCN 62-11]|nr:protein kinase [Candidatus Eremiobacteraeota bacterium]ODT58453.1 MAG: hypothetical protein ABS71_18950 [bacterium SCN 62-11]